MATTLFDKIWDYHYVASRDDGSELLYIDRHVMHELHAPHAFSELERSGRTLRRPDLTMSVLDHTVPTKPGASPISTHIDATRSGAKKFGFRLIDVAEPSHGIGHVVSPELGVALPGLTLACPDSHASTVGALGCLAFGCGATELAHVLSTQTMALFKPKQMRINFRGSLGRGVGGKDLALHLIRRLGVEAGRSYAVEYAGEAVEAMEVEARMTLCNMTIEWGARTCLVAPDDKTFAFCQGRPASPAGDAWEKALAWWRTLRTDDGAVFDREVDIDCLRIGPQITWGTDPAQTIGVDELIPSPQTSEAEKQGRTQHALKYMGLIPGEPIAGTPVDRVFIGSCCNSRLSDLRLAAEVVRGRHVAEGVTAIVVPGSSTVKRNAEEEGLDAVFRAAGFEWRNSGCSMCVGANEDAWKPGDRVVSTTNRNFENRQGRGVRTHLASAAMAAAAAVAGRIVDVRKLLTREA